MVKLHTDSVIQNEEFRLVNFIRNAIKSECNSQLQTEAFYYSKKSKLLIYLTVKI